MAMLIVECGELSHRAYLIFARMERAEWTPLLQQSLRHGAVVRCGNFIGQRSTHHRLETAAAHQNRQRKRPLALQPASRRQRQPPSQDRLGLQSPDAPCFVLASHHHPFGTRALSISAPGQCSPRLPSPPPHTLPVCSPLCRLRESLVLGPLWAIVTQAASPRSQFLSPPRSAALASSPSISAAIVVSCTRSAPVAAIPIASPLHQCQYHPRSASLPSHSFRHLAAHNDSDRSRYDDLSCPTTIISGHRP
jgi:hypothetical protein